MNNENTSIHDFDLSLICEYFSNLKRQGPGSPQSTLKALSFVGELTADSRIADIGCGTGGQTITLAQNTPATITGLDLFPDFINLFNRNAAELNLQNRLKGVAGSMDNLPFADEEFDLIWSEGAIYNIGFERGLNEWRRYLKAGGYIAVTESSWFTDERPAEIEDFWYNAYAEMDTISTKIAQLQKAGYTLTAAFALPEECWTANYYALHAPVQDAFLKKYAGNKTIEHFIACQRHEVELYRKYKAYYGYVFYIAKKNA